MIRGVAGRRPGSPRVGERGQAAVEFVLVLPLVLLVLLALLQGALVVRDLILVTGAAREAAREGAVSPDRTRIEAAARRYAPGLELSVDVDRGRHRGDPVVVVVSAPPVALPLVGALVTGRTVRGSATMRVERAGL